MNWVGGSRARANALRQQNRFQRINQTLMRDTQPNDGEIDDGEDAVSSTTGLTQSSDHGPAPPINNSRARGAAKRRKVDGLADWKKQVDYEALGYELVRPERKTRVVPLLELAEKIFPPPMGHALSLQLRFQMDICRVPEYLSAEEEMRDLTSAADDDKSLPTSNSKTSNPPSANVSTTNSNKHSSVSSNVSISTSATTSPQSTGSSLTSAPYFVSPTVTTSDVTSPSLPSVSSSLIL